MKTLATLQPTGEGVALGLRVGPGAAGDENKGLGCSPTQTVSQPLRMGEGPVESRRGPTKCQGMGRESPLASVRTEKDVGSDGAVIIITAVGIIDPKRVGPNPEEIYPKRIPLAGPVMFSMTNGLMM